MARKSGKLIENSESAIISEAHAANNPNMTRIIEAMSHNFKAGSGSNSLERTAVIPNPRDVYEVKDGRVVLIAMAGWAVSIEEKAEIDRILADPIQKENNEKIWASQDELGIKSRKATVGYKEVKVLNQPNEDDD
jgi:hypothetical protein